MKKLVQKNSDLVFVFTIFIIAKAFLYAILFVSRSFLPTNYTFLGQSRLANFDGVHYLSIAENGYGYAQQAFFPVFPLLIRCIHEIIGISYIGAGIILSNAIFSLLLYVFLKFSKKVLGQSNSKWVLIFYLSLPMAFFLQCLYTESLFLLLVIFSFFMANQKKYFLAFLTAGIASGTRVVGIFLLPAMLVPLVYSARRSLDTLLISKIVLYTLTGIIGLAGYIWYLALKYKDPFLFLHTQSAFGANRSSGELVLLPQVLFRYIKILLTVSPSTLTFWISVSELIFLFLAIGICVAALKTKIPKQYTVFSFVLVIFPTLTGTLSSIPRYTLAAVVIPMFFTLWIKNTKTKIALIFCMILSQIIFASLFFSGFFVS